MEHRQIINKIEEIIEDIQTGVLTTIDHEEKNSSKWMVAIWVRQLRATTREGS